MSTGQISDPELFRLTVIVGWTPDDSQEESSARRAAISAFAGSEGVGWLPDANWPNREESVFRNGKLAPSAIRGSIENGWETVRYGLFSHEEFVLLTGVAKKGPVSSLGDWRSAAGQIWDAQFGIQGWKDRLTAPEDQKATPGKPRILGQAWINYIEREKPAGDWTDFASSRFDINRFMVFSWGVLGLCTEVFDGLPLFEVYVDKKNPNHREASAFLFGQALFALMSYLKAVQFLDFRLRRLRQALFDADRELFRSSQAEDIWKDQSPATINREVIKLTISLQEHSRRLHDLEGVAISLEIARDAIVNYLGSSASLCLVSEVDLRSRQARVDVAYSQSEQAMAERTLETLGTLIDNQNLKAELRLVKIGIVIAILSFVMAVFQVFGQFNLIPTPSSKTAGAVTESPKSPNDTPKNTWKH